MHQDYGHYAGKHSPEEEINKTAEAELQKHVRNEKISCRSAHETAEKLGISPAEVGKTIDLMEIRIMGCQLGLFGIGKGRGKAESAMPENAAAVKEEIKKLSENGRISCLGLWTVAGNTGCSKQEAAMVCEKAEIKIVDCQLGAF